MLLFGETLSNEPEIYYFIGFTYVTFFIVEGILEFLSDDSSKVTESYIYVFKTYERYDFLKYFPPFNINDFMSGIYSFNYSNVKSFDESSTN